MGGGIWPCCSGACTVFPQVGGQHFQLLLALFAAFNASYKLSLPCPVSNAGCHVLVPSGPSYRFGVGIQTVFLRCACVPDRLACVRGRKDGMATFIWLCMFSADSAVCGQSLLYSGNVDRMTAWDHDAFFGLFVIHKMVAPAYYLALLHAVVKLGQPHWYNKTVWVHRFTAV
jgi:hypothetical protein